MIPKPKFSLRSRASFVIADMERDSSLTCSAACILNKIQMPNFLQLIRRPKHKDLGARYDVVRHPFGGREQIRGQTRMTNWIK